MRYQYCLNIYRRKVTVSDSLCFGMHRVLSSVLLECSYGMIVIEEV